MQATWREAAGRGDPVILPLNAPAPQSSPVPAQPHIAGRPEDLPGHYDLTISHPEPRPDCFLAFDALLATAAAARGLTCGVLHEAVLDAALARLAAGGLSVGYHLDYFALWHLPEDRYARLAQAVEDAGGASVNPTPRSRLFTDKSAAHAELLRHGFGVPAALVLRPGSPDRLLTGAERSHLGLGDPGRRVFVKPANGFGGRGVARLDPAHDAAYLAVLRQVRDLDRRDSYQVQREVRPPRVTACDGRERPAYWRMLYCLGDLFGFWWSPREAAPDGKSYRRLDPDEVHRLGLGALFDYARDLARLCGLNFFSTELCLGDGDEPSRYRVPGPGGDWPVIAVDYVNDQCDVDVQSRWPGGPPDDVVRHLAARFADAAIAERRRRAGEVLSLRLAA